MGIATPLPILLAAHDEIEKFQPEAFFAGLALHESSRRAYSPKLCLDLIRCRRFGQRGTGTGA
jgi:hypothetical protein